MTNVTSTRYRQGRATDLATKLVLIGLAVFGMDWIGIQFASWLTGHPPTIDYFDVFCAGVWGAILRGRGKP